MKVRHAAALALVGWYLMVPPSESINMQTGKPAPLFDKNAWIYPKAAP
jgi:hypothetical protein